MSDIYELRTLSKTFQEHHEKYLKNMEELDQKYPDRDRTCDSEFSVTLAFKSMVDEIIYLHFMIDQLQDQIIGERIYLTKQREDMCKSSKNSEPSQGIVSDE